MKTILAYVFGSLLTMGVFVITSGVMAPLQHLQCMLDTSVHAAGAQMPPPGNPGHPEPPFGQSCVHEGMPGADEGHVCACHRECKPNLDDEGEVTAGEHVQEDAKCRAFCHPKHCNCPIDNCE